MGNDNSSLDGLKLDDKAVEVTDFWTHHTATVCTGNAVSVFIGEPMVSGSLWLRQTPLEKATKNLTLYRHPCILKYISSWHKGSKFYLALEDVKPLSLVLTTQNTLDLCIGLYSILKAVCFLHEKAYVSHNNICISSIYITKDGNWKLGGMEYLCRFMDLNEEYLCKTRVHRYDKAVDTNENKIDKRNRPDAIDCYAFGVLVNEVLHKRTNDDLYSLSSFRELCKNQLQNADVKFRPKLSTLLNHEFFTHDFIFVHSFLTELPLKSAETKAEFFATLINKLRTFNEAVVASQLGGLLLSRIVLLDKNAQQDLLPNILCPRYGDNVESNGLFSTDNFKHYLIPRLLQIFCVRDAQIRLLLLEHFNQYMKCFSVDELQLQILPELLVGIKDTNDHLVAVTLRALADIVPILGAATVIGGQRGKLFNDGRPILHSSRISKKYKSEALLQTIPSIDNEISRINLVEIDHLDLPERPRPDGEEGETSTGDIEQSVEDELEQWDVWDLNDNATHSVDNNSITTTTVVSSDENTISTSDITVEDDNLRILPHQLHSSSNTNILHKKKLVDINELDIKNQVRENQDEFNFFQDMEPVIQTTPKFLLSHEDNEKTKDMKATYNAKLGVTEVEQHVEGWGDIDWE